MNILVDSMEHIMTKNFADINIIFVSELEGIMILYY